MGNNTDFKQVPFPGLINDINTVNVESTYTSPTGATNRFGGFLGSIITLDNYDAYQHSDTTSVGTLYHGRYQLVQNAGSASVRGQAAFWPAASLSALAIATRYQVTSTATDGDFAGVWLNAVTANYYGWIQIEGLASCLFRATMGVSTPATKDLIYTYASNATFDDLQNGSMTDAILKRLVGIAEAAPANNTISLVEIFPRIRNW